MNNYNNMNVNNNCGYLELIIGPMYSGKTSKILEIYRQCKFCDIPVAVINHSFDKRYHNSMLSSHDKIMIPCLQAYALKDIWYNNNRLEDYDSLQKASVILINEGQFFEDLFEIVIDMLKNKKQIYICGLDGDFERKKFGQILDLIPFCDKVNKLTSLCSICKNGTPAIFSLRLTNETQQTVIGSENYLPVCRNCYDIKSIKNDK
jgi:thymidine kinase